MSMHPRWSTLMMLALAGCGGSETPDDAWPDPPTDQPSPVPYREHLTANINGTPFAAGFVLGEQVGAELRFQSDQSQERQMFFVVPADVTPGTYALVNNQGYSVRYAQLFEGEYETQNGSLTISSHDTVLHRVAGTFAYTAQSFEFGELDDTVKVTDGSFQFDYWVIEQ